MSNNIRFSNDFWGSIPYGWGLFGELSQLSNSTLKWLQAYASKRTYLDKLHLTKIYKNIELDKKYHIKDVERHQELLKTYLTEFGQTLAQFEELERMYEALTVEYDPIANVDGKEITTHGGTDRHVYESVRDVKDIIGSIINDKTGNDDNITSGKMTQSDKTLTNFTAEQKTTLERDTSYDDYKNQINYNNTTKQSYEGYSEINDKSGSEIDDYGHVITLERHGNIGVTMTQQLINAELSLREKSFWNYVYYLWQMWFTNGIFKSDSEIESVLDRWW